MKKRLCFAILSALLTLSIHSILEAQPAPKRPQPTPTTIAPPTVILTNDGSKPYAGFTGDPYTKDPKQLITQDFFGNWWVNVIPEDPVVPSPWVHHGYIAGSWAALTPYSGPKGTYDYYATLAKTSPRVKMWNIGKTHGGVDMYIVAISCAETIKTLDQYQANLQKLGDPRKLGYPANPKAADEAAQKIIDDPASGKPILWVMGKVHSNEISGSEMLMELAYRLAVDERPIFKEIRDNVIVFITDPNPDGTDMVANWVNHYKQDSATAKANIEVLDGPSASAPFYNWYDQHDDNRDTFANAQVEWKNLVKASNEWPTQVQIQLHEQGFLHETTGSASLPQSDPISESELKWLGEREMSQFQVFSMPGARLNLGNDCSSYPFSGDMLGTLKNAIGKHYETWHAGIFRPYTLQDVKPPENQGAVWSASSLLPYPYPKLVWSLRDNINYTETGVLANALEMARSREILLEEFWIKSKNAISVPGTTYMACNGRMTYPIAYVVPAGQKDMPDTVNMINNLLENGIEVSVAKEAFTAADVKTLSLPSIDAPANNGGKTYPAGSYIISLGQPFSRLVYTLIEPQAMPAEGDWQYGLMRGVAVDRVDDKTILSVPAMPITAKKLDYPYTVGAQIPEGYYAISHNSVNNIVTLVFSLSKAGYKSYAAEASKGDINPGDLLVPAEQKGVYAALKPLVEKLGLTMHSVAAPGVATHQLNVPRIAMYHAWDGMGIQQGGWSRFTFEQFEVPYTIIQRTDVIAGDLRSKYDVIFLPDDDANIMKTGKGVPGPDRPDRPDPLDEVWYGPVQTKHRNGGLGDTGIAELKKFVDAGGVLICNNASSELPIINGFVKDVTILKPHSREPQNSFEGSSIAKVVLNRTSPINYGMAEEEAILQSGSPVFTAPADAVVASYPADLNQIVLSGGLRGADKIAGKAAIVAAKAEDGAGWVILFGTDITYRWQAQGAYIYLWNALLNWDHLQ